MRLSAARSHRSCVLSSVPAARLLLVTNQVLVFIYKNLCQFCSHPGYHEINSFFFFLVYYLLLVSVPTICACVWGPHVEGVKNLEKY